MLISDIRVLTCDANCELQATVTSSVSGELMTLWYRFPIDLRPYVTATSGDVWLAALLLLAMRLGEELTIEAPVSPRLKRAVKTIQALYRSWDPSLGEVAVRAPVVRADVGRGSPSGRMGVFFSLGVDSFYSVLKRTSSLREPQQKPPGLILVHGFDIFVGRANSELFPEVLANARMVARSLDTEVLPVSTNLRDLSDYFVDWGSLYHGAALASVGLALGGFFRVVLVAAGMVEPYAHEDPWGSSPALDPLWSTEYLTFVHDGCEASRLDKIRLITRVPVVLKTLRVCWENPNDEYNCCRCAKCLRTMICLYVSGTLSRSSTFALPLDPAPLRNFPIGSRNQRALCEEMLRALGESAFDLQIKSALTDALSRSWDE